MRAFTQLVHSSTAGACAYALWCPWSSKGQRIVYLVHSHASHPGSMHAGAVNSISGCCCRRYLRCLLGFAAEVKLTLPRHCRCGDCSYVPRASVQRMLRASFGPQQERLDAANGVGLKYRRYTRCVAQYSAETEQHSSERQSKHCSAWPRTCTLQHFI